MNCPGKAIWMFVPLVHSESTLGPGDLSTDVAGVGDVIDQVISFDVSLYIFDCKCQKKTMKKSHVLVLRKRSIPWYLCGISPTSDIWTIILFVYLSFCWPYLNFPLIYCPLRMSPRALFVSVMWAPSRNGAVNIQWVHQTPWREIKRRKKLGTIRKKEIMPLEEKICYVCVEPQWSSLHSMRADSDTFQPPFAGINITCSVFQFKVDRVRENIWATHKITYFGNIFTV